jgi:hypothetical protein
LNMLTGRMEFLKNKMLNKKQWHLTNNSSH